MADNLTLNAGSGGSDLATDDVGGIHYQIIKEAFGALDSATLAASGAGAVSAGVQRVTLASDDPAVTDLAAIEIATEAIQAAVETAGGLVVNLGANNDVTVTGTVDLGATDNAVLDAIAASVAAIDTDATTIIGHVDGIEGLLTTIDGDTGNMATSLATLDNLVLAEDAVHQTGDPGVQVLAVRQSSQADFGADGDYVPLSIDDDGGLRVSIVAGAGSGGTASADDADFVAGTTSGTPAMGVYESSPSSVTDGDMGVVGITQTRALRTSVEGTVTVASHAVTNAGTFAVQAAQSGTWTVDLGATDNGVLDAIAASVAAIDTDATTIIGHVDGIEGLLTTMDADTGSILTAVQIIDNPVLVDDAAFTPGTSSVMMAGFQADESSTDSVNEGDAGAARMTLDRKVIVTPQPHTAGGLTIFRSLDIDESEEDVKTSAGVLYSIAAFNTTAAPLYLKFYNATAANVTVGTTTPVLTFLVPGNADSDGAGFILEKTYGWSFGTAISVACTTGVADNDTGAPGANACIINLGYA